MLIIGTLLSVQVQSQKIILDGKAVIHITREMVNEVLPVTAQVVHVFPSNDVSTIQDSLTINQDDIWLTIPVRTPQIIHLTLQDDRIKIFATPKDSVHLFIKKSPIDNSYYYLFEGKTKNIQSYYLQQRNELSSSIEQQAMNLAMQSPNLEKLQIIQDSLTKLHKRFLNSYIQKNDLPKTFKDFETDNINYFDAFLRLYMLWYQPDIQNKIQPTPKNYFDFLKSLTIRNESAQYNYFYLKFLYEYIGYNLRQKSNKERDFDNILYSFIDDKLGYNLGSFYKIWMISQGVDNPELSQRELKNKKFSNQHNYLIEYLSNRSNSRFLNLSSGSKAPNFFLTDTNDSTISLNNFRGKVVYLSFWFAGCSGCYKEFPFENRLVNEFKGQKVEIVSICTATPLDRWKQTIKRVNLKTKNLFANPSWKKTLEEKYIISTYPHYVLIDADGKIVENFAPRPSENVAIKIKALLAEGRQ